MTVPTDTIREVVDQAAVALMAAATRHGVPATLLRALLRLESGERGRFGSRGINTRVSSLLERPASAEAEASPSAANDRFVLARLQLQNFRQFRQVDLSFDFDPARPVHLIEGSNGFGKSHLVEALRFALGRRRVPEGVRATDLLHRYVEGSKATLVVQVELASDHLGLVRIRRQLDFHRVGEAWSPRGTVSVTVSLEGSSLPLQDTDALDWLSQRLPSEVLDYFIFDAESAVVQKLSGQAGERLPDVRPQVEAALGVTAARRVAERCREFARNRDDQLEELGTVPTVRQAEAEVERLNAERASVQRDWERAVARHEAAQAELDDVLTQLRAAQGQPAPAGDRPAEAIEDELRELGSRRHELRHTLRELASEALPLALLTRPEAAASPAGRPPAPTRDTPELRRVLNRLARWIEEGRFRWALGAAAQVEADLIAALGLDTQDEPTSVTRRLAAARELLSARLPKDDPDLLAISIEQAELDLQAALGASPDAEREEAFEALLERSVLITSNRDREAAEATSLARRRDGLDDDLVEAQAAMADSRTADRRRAPLTVERDRARATAAALDELAEALLADRLSALERGATRMLRQTTNKPDLYDRVNFARDTLRYALLDPDGQPVPPGRSTGERTVLALALVFGLQRASGLRFPLFIEAPLKPLDPRHQDSVVRELLKLDTAQSVLLVKPGEFPPALDELVRVQVAQRLVLRRETRQKDITSVVEAKP